MVDPYVYDIWAILIHCFWLRVFFIPFCFEFFYSSSSFVCWKYTQYACFVIFLRSSMHRVSVNFVGQLCSQSILGIIELLNLSFDFIRLCLSIPQLLLDFIIWVLKIYAVV